MNWDVYVVNSDNDPVEGTKVTVFFTGLLRGNLEEYTDQEGHAYFDYDVDEGEAEIYVKHEKFGPHYIEDGNGYTIEI